jgi:hypothetical protein
VCIRAGLESRDTSHEAVLVPVGLRKEPCVAVCFMKQLGSGAFQASKCGYTKVVHEPAVSTARSRPKAHLRRQPCTE